MVVPHGASWTWPRGGAGEGGGGDGGGGGGAGGASGSGAGPSGGWGGGANGCSARGAGGATRRGGATGGGAIGFAVGAGSGGGGSGVSSPNGIGRIGPVAQQAPFGMSAATRSIGTGKCAAPTTLKALPSAAMGTAHTARIRRQHGRRAAPSICGSARKPSGDSGLQPATIFIIAGARRLRS